MKKLIILSIACLLWQCGLQAQKVNDNRIKYFGSVQTGFQAGSSDVDLSVNMLNGIQWKSWILAAGTGYDGYGIPGIPLTLYAQKNFTNLKHKPFVYAQSGMAIALKTNDWATKAYDNKDLYLLNNGFTAEAGVGYQWRLGKKIQLMANTGFSYKHHHAYERQVYYWISEFPINQPDRYYAMDYYYRRIVCRFGIIF